eukprot:768766-Hanusia_phi.AAC.7
MLPQKDGPPPGNGTAARLQYRRYCDYSTRSQPGTSASGWHAMMAEPIWPAVQTLRLSDHRRPGGELKLSQQQAQSHGINPAPPAASGAVLQVETPGPMIGPVCQGLSPDRRLRHFKGTQGGYSTEWGSVGGSGAGAQRENMRKFCTAITY